MKPIGYSRRRQETGIHPPTTASGRGSSNSLADNEAVKAESSEDLDQLTTLIRKGRNFSMNKNSIISRLLNKKTRDSVMKNLDGTLVKLFASSGGKDGFAKSIIVDTFISDQSRAEVVNHPAYENVDLSTFIAMVTSRSDKNTIKDLVLIAAKSNPNLLAALVREFPKLSTFLTSK